MARYCEYCGSNLGPDDRVCPGCGAPVTAEAEAYAPVPSSGGIPSTIDELKAFCREKNMPLAQMRFFIGQDYPDPRAFGIYRDYDGNYVVYKNKSDGSRSIRYQGPDEAYAVREIYLKLRDETEKRRGIARNPQPVRSGGGGKKSLAGIFSPIIVVIIAAVLAVSMLIPSGPKKPYNGYYHFDDNYYYYQDDNWYYYSNTVLDWLSAGMVDPELEDHFEDYYSSSYYHQDYGIEDFSESAYYDSESREEDDDSDSWDYDYDSWDAGDTDWNSDW